MDPATGELTGVIKDYVELAKDCLQGQTLEFDLKGYDTRNEQLQALHTREIDRSFMSAKILIQQKQTVLSCLIPYGPLIWLLLRQRTLLMKMQKIQLRLRKIILR